MTGNKFHTSPQQRRLWHLRQGRACVNNHLVVELYGPLAPERLRVALEALINRHEILRTGFLKRSDLKQVLQVIDETARLDWAIASVAASDSAEAIATALAEIGVDEPGREPFLAARLLVLGDIHHLLVLAISPLRADRTSLVLLMGALAETYSRTEPDGEALQYADFVAWQDELRADADEEADRGRALWQMRAQAKPTPFALPDAANAAGKALVGHDPIRLRRALDHELFDRMNELAQIAGTPIDAVAIGVLAALLMRLTGTETFVFGYRHRARKFEEMAAAIGPYAVTLPLPLSVRNGDSFSEIVRITAKALAQSDELLEYFEPASEDCVPFPIQIEPWVDGSPVSAADLRFSVFDLDTCDEPGDLRIALDGAEQNPALVFSFGRATLGADQANRFTDRFIACLERASADPERAIGSLSLLLPEERLRLATVPSGTQAPPIGLPFREFERRAEEQGTATALVFEDTAWSFDELNRRANRLAHKLLGHNLDRGSGEPIVALALDRSADVVAAMLAVHKAGAAYLPLDLSLPQQRTAFLLTDSGAKLVIAPKGAAPAIGDLPVETLDWQALADCPDHNPKTTVDDAGLAYVIYTSGSTGQPKGVAVTHANLRNYVRGALARFAFAAGDGFAMVSTPFADLGMTMLFPALACGGRLHIFSHATATDAHAFAAAMENHRIDHLKIVPSHLTALLEGSPGNRLLPGKTLILGGEACSPNLLRAIRGREPRCRIFNHYGPTETTVGVLALDITGQADGPGFPCSPLGNPLFGSRTFVGSNSAEPMPDGVVGEIFIAGAGLARGYLNRPALTAATYLPNPLALGEDAGSRIYRSGDLARTVRSGNAGDPNVEDMILFLGRRDDQVKLFGHRIQLKEIEAALGRHGQIVEARALLGYKHERPRLLAYYIPVAGTKPEPEQLREFLLDHLPEVMVPHRFIALASWPLTPNGKLDRAALPDPESGSGLPDYTAPRNAIEAVLCEVWCETLQQNRIGVLDNFFQIGGDSITSIIAATKAADRGIHLTVMQILEHQTIAELAKVAKQVETDGNHSAATETSPFALAGAAAGQMNQLRQIYPAMADAYPLSPVQKGMLFHGLYDHDARAYMEQKILELGGAWDPDHFQAAWHAVVAHHPVLRSAFVWDDLDEPLQFFEDTCQIALDVRDLRDLPPEEQESLFRNFLDEDRAAGFELGRPPLMRFTLFRLANDRLRFVWSHLHILLDGWSLPHVIRDFIAAYRATSAGQPLSLKARRPYRDYIAWLGRQNLGEAEGFWRDYLAGFALPNRIDQAAQGASGPIETGDVYLRETAQLDAAATEKLRAWAKSRQLTLSTVFQAAWALIVARLSGRDDVVFGATVSGRPASLAGVEEIVGIFINTLPVRFRIAPEANLLEWLEIHQRQQFAIRAFEHSPLNQVQNWSDVAPGESLFQSVFVFENLPEIQRGAALDLSGLAVEVAAYTAYEKTNYPMLFQVVPAETFDFLVMYDRALFSAGAVKTMLSMVIFLLTRFIEGDRPLAQLESELAEFEQSLAKQARERNKSAGYLRFKNAKPKAAPGLAGQGSIP